MRRREQSWIARPPFTTTLVLVIALVAAAGFCAVDAHAGAEHGSSPALDLCIGMTGVSAPSAPPVALAVVGRALVAGHVGIALSPLAVLELPPKP